MYVEYFGLRESPFALPPDPRYLYLSIRHQEALAHLMYGITESGGFVQLTGEVGTGKTMMIRAMLERLPENVDVALILYPFLSVREFIAAICDDLGVRYPEKNDSVKTLIYALNIYLLENHAKGRRTVLIIDEAHKLSRDVLEQIRLLTNLETTKEKLLQILLIGQPELIGLLAQQDLRQLSQRITARYILKSLLLRETCEYIVHRCRVAGAQAPLFTKSALQWMHRLSGGVPRLINIICDRSLLGAYAQGKHMVGVKMVRKAAAELGRAVPRNYLARAWLPLFASTLIALIGLVIWQPTLLFGTQAEPKTMKTADSQSNQMVSNTPTSSDAAVTKTASTGDDTMLLRHMVAVKPTSDIPAVQPELKNLLTDGNIVTDTESAFDGLYSRWGLDYAKLPGTTGCDRALNVGLRCIFTYGTWNNLRQFNRPAVIELIDQDGNRHHVLVSGLTEDRITLEFDGRQYEFPMAKVDRYWFGKFLLLWKPPDLAAETLRRGMRGRSIAWLRDALARYSGRKTTSGGGEVFDAHLEIEVKQFQRQHQLLADGIVGKLTVIQLNAYDPNMSPPVLTTANEAGTS